MPKNSLKNPAKNLGLLTTTIFICTSLSAMPSALKQPYTQPDKTRRQHHQHQLSRQETKAQHSRTKQNKRKLSIFSAISAPHTPTTFTVFYSVSYLWCMYGRKKPVTASKYGCNRLLSDMLLWFASFKKFSNNSTYDLKLSRSRFMLP